jgi:hypothetical protein
MTRLQRMYHFVSIAGRVVDGVSKKPLEGALIEIIDGPPEYDQRLAAIKGDPDWWRRPNRPDRTYSRAYGMFVFVDLPDGDYRVRVSLPAQGSRYGVTVLPDPCTVQPPPVPPESREGEEPPRWPDPAVLGNVPSGAGWYTAAQVNVELPPTRIHGTVKNKDGALAGAKVRLRGDTNVVRTDAQGFYELTRLVKGNPTVEVTAAGHRTAVSQPIPLGPGQDRECNFVLEK